MNKKRKTKKLRVAWFYWKEYILPEAYNWEVEELIGVVLHIRYLDVVLKKENRIIKADETAVEKFSIYIEATNGEILEKLEIMYDRGEVNVWKIEEKE